MLVVNVKKKVGHNSLYVCLSECETASTVKWIRRFVCHIKNDGGLNAIEFNFMQHVYYISLSIPCLTGNVGSVSPY